MPLYDYECDKCGVVEVYHGMKDDRPKRCTQCGKAGFTKCFNARASFIPPPDSGWEHMNNGAGEYMPQMGKRYIGDPREKRINPASHCRSLTDAIDRFKRQGKSDIERT